MHTKYKIKRAERGRGLGLFATATFQKGDFVIEYTGKKIPTKQADQLTTKYLFDLENGWTIDGSPRSNTARYINHSCDPNCEVEIEDGRLMIYTVKNLVLGEELSFDYGEEYYKEFIKPHGCKCSAAKHY